MRISPRIRSLSTTLAGLVFWAQGAVASDPPAVKLFVREPGLYRVPFEDLAALGWPAGIRSEELTLTERGRAVPVDLEDGGDGRFGGGDAIVFLGDRLAGEHGYYNEFSAFNVYRLAVAAPGAGRRFAPLSEQSAPGVGVPSPWQRRIRFEQDRLLLRYPDQGLGDDELWYWAKLSQIDPRPFEVEVHLEDLAPTGGPVRITAELRGWSRPANKPAESFADHRVELLWDGEPLAAQEWNGFTRPSRLIAEVLPPAAATPGIHRLGLRVPARPASPGGDPLVDVVVLNWLEVVAPVGDRLDPAAVRRLEPLGWGEGAGPAADGGSVPAFSGRLRVPAGMTFEVYSEAGGRGEVAAPPEGERLVSLTGPGAGAPLWAVGPGNPRAVDGLEPDQPSALRSGDHGADYLIVSHPRLLDAVRPLAELHRRRGLRVELVDVRDIYDEWNDGIVSPKAIRDFVAHAFHSWRRPAPRFLLLVGDASWDGKNDRALDESPDWAFQLTDRAGFIKNGSTPYGGSDSRNLVPAWDYGTHEGHAAGDNGYVAVDGDDELPDLAVGRFPVVEPGEVEAIVAKTVAYLDAAPLGDWRTRVLWVTNEDLSWQRASDDLSALLAGRGFGARKVYPAPVLPAEGQDQAVLRGAFDAGELLVHFVGHGGRYIWRTGPPDLATQRDLFDLKDVERLAPSRRLPLVISLTCYSAPFDHPTADSIGEKLLRQAGRGAIGVFAASWRNSPSEVWSRRLVDELLKPGTVGEALQRVKREVGGQDFVRQYNLLGDPALELALPRESIAVTPGRTGDGVPVVRARMPAGLAGRFEIEWTDARGEVVAREDRPVEGRELTLRPDVSGAEASRITAVRLYAADDGERRDARGGAEFPPAATSTPDRKETGHGP